VQSVVNKRNISIFKVRVFFRLRNVTIVVFLPFIIHLTAASVVRPFSGRNIFTRN
jgi:hypothetical protein